MPFRFDAAPAAAEALALEEAAWERHFNTGYYEGDWSGVPLRSTGGRIGLLAAPAAATPFADTEYLERCPGVRSLLALFDSPLNSVRFLRLGPGARVREHRDYGLEPENGEARFHVPLLTGPGAEFVLDGVPVFMNAGECWYIDVSKPHRVGNGGPSPRIHLVVDCIVNDSLRRTMRDAAAV